MLISVSVDNAFIFINPAIDKGVIPASEPPVIIISASLYFIDLKAIPIAWLLDAHAETTEKFGPLNPFFIEIWPGAISEIILGTK